MQVIVGSYAAKYNLPEWHRVTDVDIWTDKPIPKEQGLDICQMPTNILEAFEQYKVASLNDLYTIKVSHLPYDLFWWKHVQHALVFKKHGARLNQNLYKLLKEHWKGVHGTKDFLSLYRSKTEFFDDAVPKLYEHDWLHELVAHPNRPVYTTVLKDGQEVLVDKSKFDQLEFAEQVKMFREEMAVIMCERWLLNPKCRNMPLSKAWHMSVRKTTTALTKGFASAFICENIEHFIKPNPEETAYLFKTIERMKNGK